MVVVRPFNALRPDAALAEKVSALPYDVMNHEEAKKMAADNDVSFLHISRSDIDLASEEQIHDQVAYDTAKKNLDDFQIKNILKSDEKPLFYLYRQTMNGRQQLGLVATVSVDEYISGKIKKHELTRKEKELDRICHFDTCQAQTEPIFLAYRRNDRLNEIFEKCISSFAPEYDFVSEDGIGHELWPIKDDGLNGEIKIIFNNIDSLYIADGHHRAASGAEVCMRQRIANPNFSGDEEFNFIMAVLFQEQELMIMDYNRVVSDLNGLTKEEFLAKLSEVFDIAVFSVSEPYVATQTHEFGMYLENCWYKCVAKSELYAGADQINVLDCAILQKFVLQPILGIEDPRTDTRIDFVGGIRGLKELERRCATDMKIAFSLSPVTMQELFDVADAGKIMPPKSTWFEPKLRSGLFVHKF